MSFCPLPLITKSQPNNNGSPNSLVDRIIWPDTRSQAIYRNVCIRRGRDVDVIAHVYPDKNTADVFRDMNKGTNIHGRNDGKTRAGSIFSISLDRTVCMMNSSLQVTMQPQNIGEARKLYDQLIPLCPIMLALTAATTIWNDVLVDTDARWDIMSACFDDRTVDEISDMVRTVLFVRFCLDGDLYVNWCRTSVERNSD